MTRISPSAVRFRDGRSRLHWRRALLATTAALSLGQNAAWATCLDGTAFPPGGYQIGSKPVAIAANWSPNVFTSTEGSYFIPDSSTADQVTGAPTGGGHNWAFDQGSTLCKDGDAGSATGTTAWILPPNTSTDCIVPADHQERQGDQPRRHPVPGFGRHPGLRCDQAERIRTLPHCHHSHPQPGQHLRQPARLLDRRFQQRWQAREQHCGHRDVLHVRRRHQGRPVQLSAEHTPARIGSAIPVNDTTSVPNMSSLPFVLSPL